MHDFRHFIWLIGIAVVFLFWRTNVKARDIAFTAAKRHCESIGVQFLDDTVAQKSISIKKRDLGGIAIQRKFGFEFATTGADRYKGVITMQGYRTSRIQLAPHVIPENITPTSNDIVN